MIKKLLFTAFFVFFAVQITKAQTSFNQFLLILGKIESENNDKAVGDKGHSIGRYAITKQCFLDCKKVDKSLQGFDWRDVTKKSVADRVVWDYCFKWQAEALKTGNWENLARLWNSGPDFKSKMFKTDKYWQRFKNAEKELTNR